MDLDPKGTNNHIKETINKRYIVDEEGITPGMYREFYIHHSLKFQEHNVMTGDTDKMILNTYSIAYIIPEKETMEINEMEEMALSNMMQLIGGPPRIEDSDDA